MLSRKNKATFKINYLNNSFMIRRKWVMKIQNIYLFNKYIPFTLCRLHRYPNVELAIVQISFSSF